MKTAVGSTGPTGWSWFTWHNSGAPTQLPDRTVTGFPHAPVPTADITSHWDNSTVGVCLGVCWRKREKVRSSSPGLGEVPKAKRESRGLPASSTLWLVPLAAAGQPGPNLMCLQPISPSPPSPAAQLLHLPVLEGQATAVPQPPSETSSFLP